MGSIGSTAGLALAYLPNVCCQLGKLCSAVLTTCSPSLCAWLQQDGGARCTAGTHNALLYVVVTNSDKARVVDMIHFIVMHCDRFDLHCSALRSTHKAMHPCKCMLHAEEQICFQMFDDVVWTWQDDRPASESMYDQHSIDVLMV